MKSERQQRILEIISQKNIETQNQMLEELQRSGIRSTQATLSRDIKELRLIKELTPDGTYRYAAVVRGESDDNLSRLQKIFRECVVKYDTAQNIVVIHTLPGLANAAASALDALNIPELVGTLAGDDTAFLVMRGNKQAEELCREIEAML